MLHASYFLPMAEYRYSTMKHRTMIPIQADFLPRRNVLLHASKFGYSPMSYHAKEAAAIDAQNTLASTFGDAVGHHLSTEAFEMLKNTQSYDDTLSPMSTSSAPATPFSAEISQQNKKLFSCLQCSYATDRKNNLKRHVITMHLECSRKLECCGIQFRSKATIREHVNSCHKNGYCCSTCGRVFCRKALLRRHWTVHSGVKEFHCTSCNYATSHKSNLERHQRVHCRETTFNVLACKKVSTDQSLHNSQNTNRIVQLNDTSNPNSEVINENVENDRNNNNTYANYCETRRDSSDLCDRGHTGMAYRSTKMINDDRLLDIGPSKNQIKSEYLENNCRNVLMNDTWNSKRNQNMKESVEYFNCKENINRYEQVNNTLIDIDRECEATNSVYDKRSDSYIQKCSENVDISTEISTREILGKKMTSGFIKTGKAKPDDILSAVQPAPIHRYEDIQVMNARVEETAQPETHRDETIPTRQSMTNLKSTGKLISRNTHRLCQRPYLCGRCRHRFQTQLIHQNHNNSSKCVYSSDALEHAVSIVTKALKLRATIE